MIDTVLIANRDLQTLKTVQDRWTRNQEGRYFFKSFELVFWNLRLKKPLKEPAKHEDLFKYILAAGKQGSNLHLVDYALEIRSRRSESFSCWSNRIAPYIYTFLGINRQTISSSIKMLLDKRVEQLLADIFFKDKLENLEIIPEALKDITTQVTHVFRVIRDLRNIFTHLNEVESEVIHSPEVCIFDHSEEDVAFGISSDFYEIYRKENGILKKIPSYLKIREEGLCNGCIISFKKLACLFTAALMLFQEAVATYILDNLFESCVKDTEGTTITANLSPELFEKTSVDLQQEIKFFIRENI